MKATYQDSGSPGNGLIILTEALFPGSPWSLGIQRGSDQSYAAGKNRWIPEAFFMQVQGTAQPDGSLQIEVGPEIVDSLDQQEQYLLTLKGDGDSQKARLRINAITYSPVGSVDYTAHGPDAQEPITPVSPPATAPEPTRQITQEPTAPPTENGTQPLEMASAPHPKRKIWQFTILGVLILGCLAWYVLDPRKGDTPDTPLPQPPQTPAAEASKTLSVEEQVRQFFKNGNISPADAATLAAKLPHKTTSEQDAVYRLLYFAAENGEPSAMIAYGNALNPAMPPFGSIEKNAVEAWKAYEQSQASDPAKAHQVMEQLRNWLNQQANQGDAKAREWLLQIDQPR